MRFNISFSLNTFETLRDALTFAKNYTKSNKEGLLYTEKDILMFRDKNFWEEFDKGYLDSFEIIEQYSTYGYFGDTITYRRESLKNLEIFLYSVELKENLLLKELLNEAYKLDFSFAYIFDPHKSKWQNEKIINNYKTFKRPFEHLPKRWDPVLSPILGEVIDTFQNPGHNTETYTMSIMAAPEMWFGPASWNYFNKKKVISFPDAEIIQEIMPNVVYIKLFEWDTSNYEAPKILSLQKKFREWTGMDEIEKLLDEKMQLPKEAATLRIELDEEGKETKDEFNIWNYVNGKLKRKRE